MLRTARRLIAAALLLAASCRASAQQAEPSLSEQDWQQALAAIRQVALDGTEEEEHRAHAVTAYAKLLLGKKLHEEALSFCRDVLKSAGTPAVAEAALRAGCLVERDRRRNLRAELDFLASCPPGTSGQAAAAVRQEIERAIQSLASLAGRAMVPAPVRMEFPRWASAGPGQAPSAINTANVTARLPGWYPPPGSDAGFLRISLPEIRPPSWYRFEPGRPHPALQVTHPKMEPPGWYSRVDFPPLKDPKAR